MVKNKTNYLVKVALLAAMSVALNVFTIALSPSNFISFAFVPAFIAGIFMGPLAGAAVGFTGDLLGWIINSNGFPFLVLTSLASMLLGLIPGLIFKYLKGKNPTLLITVSFLLTYVICTAGLNTFATWNWILPGLLGNGRKTFFLYLLGRLPIQTLNTVANYIILIALYETDVIHKLMKKAVQ